MNATGRQDEATSIRDISFTVHTFKEGATYVAHAPELDVSSCGDTDEEARKNIQDAVRGFLETSAEIGTLEEVLLEAGYQHFAHAGTTSNS
jgi:predicted RNase H-like HicB family nuclease